MTTRNEDHLPLGLTTNQTLIMFGFFLRLSRLLPTSMVLLMTTFQQFEETGVRTKVQWILATGILDGELSSTGCQENGNRSSSFPLSTGDHLE